MPRFTNDDLAALNAAIASGDLRATVNGRTVEYRSITELMAAKRNIEQVMAAETAAAANKERPLVRFYRFATLRER